MSKKQSYYICLTKDPHVAINVKVDSVVEMEKAERLFKVLINKCQSSLENSSTPQEFFEELRANMEKFSEFTDFFDTTAVSMATGITQMRFHTLLVDSWDKQYAKILATAKGKANVEYNLPPPSMVFHLASKKRAKNGVIYHNHLNNYCRVGSIKVSYGFIDNDSVELEKLSENIPREAIEEAINAMIDNVEELHNKAMKQVLRDCGIKSVDDEKPISDDFIDIVNPISDDFIDVVNNDDFIGTFRHLGTVEGDSFKASEKMHELIDKMNIKASDDFDDILNKLMSNPETRELILEDFKRWRDNKDGDKDDFKGLMPKPGDFVAEA